MMKSDWERPSPGTRETPQAETKKHTRRFVRRHKLRLDTSERESRGQRGPKGRPGTPLPESPPSTGFHDHQVCAQAELCGGCTFINDSYDAQIALKSAHFSHLLKSSGLQAVEKAQSFGRKLVTDFAESTERSHYRHSVKLAVSERRIGIKRWIDVGLYRPGTHDVFDNRFCAVQDHEINQVVQSVRYLLKEQDLPVHRQELVQKGHRRIPQVTARGVRYLLVRKSAATGELSVCFVTSLPMKARLRIAARLLVQKHPRIRGISSHFNDQLGNPIVDTAQSEALEELYGDPVLHDEVAGLKMSVHPLAFFQVNPVVAARMYRRIWELAPVQPLERWLDLYCGQGAIGIGAGKLCAQVIGIEETPQAIEHATENARLNQTENWRGIVGRVEDILPRHPILLEQACPVGVVSLNPSRRGCDPLAIEAVANLNPHTIAYMSCCQETLMRDLRRFEAQGYQVRLFENFDMFPGTPHYETLALLRRTNRKVM